MKLNEINIALNFGTERCGTPYLAACLYVLALMDWMLILYFSIKMWRRLKPGVSFWHCFFIDNWKVYISDKYLLPEGMAYRRKALGAAIMFGSIVMILLFL